MCYVILSRIVCLEQLHLQTFKPSKIYCNEEAKLEALSIKARALNKQFSRWHQKQKNCFKLSSLNVRSLQKHFQDLKDDNFLQQSDILCVNETWLVEDPDRIFDGFSSHFLNKSSKGVAMFTKIVPWISTQMPCLPRGQHYENIKCIAEVIVVFVVSDDNRILE